MYLSFGRLGSRVKLLKNISLDDIFEIYPIKSVNQAKTPKFIITHLKS